MIGALVLALSSSPVIREPTPVIKSGQFICSISDAEGETGDISVRFGNYLPRKEVEGKLTNSEQFKAEISGWNDKGFPETWIVLRNDAPRPLSMLFDAKLIGKGWGHGDFRLSRPDRDRVIKGSISLWHSRKHQGFIGHCFGSLSLNPVDLKE